jgi:hypothetical protein
MHATPWITWKLAPHFFTSAKTDFPVLKWVRDPIVGHCSLLKAHNALLA